MLRFKRRNNLLFMTIDNKRRRLQTVSGKETFFFRAAASSLKCLFNSGCFRDERGSVGVYRRCEFWAAMRWQRRRDRQARQSFVLWRCLSSYLPASDADKLGATNWGAASRRINHLAERWHVTMRRSAALPSAHSRTCIRCRSADPPIRRRAATCGRYIERNARKRRRVHAKKQTVRRPKRHDVHMEHKHISSSSSSNNNDSTQLTGH